MTHEFCRTTADRASGMISTGLTTRAFFNSFKIFNTKDAAFGRGTPLREVPPNKSAPPLHYQQPACGLKTRKRVHTKHNDDSLVCCRIRRPSAGYALPPGTPTGAGATASPRRCRGFGHLLTKYRLPETPRPLGTRRQTRP